VLLLDEPSNHLDLESLIWLEAFLKTYDGALLMTSHDREFMNRIVGKIVEIDGGTLTTYSGNYDFYDQQRALNEKQRQAQFERQQAMLAKEIKFIERFKARASHAAQVQSRVKKLDKIERVEPPRRRQSVQFDFRAPPRSGDDVASFRDVHKGYGGLPIYAGLDFQVRRKERWCVLGANGAGKSTLLKMAAGEIAPDRGTFALGASVRMGYFAQHSMDLLDGDDTIFETLETAFPLAGQGALRTLAGCFGFSGDDIEKTCRVLSGGEKARLDAVRPAELPGAGRADQPPGHGNQGHAGRGVGGIRGHHAVRQPRPPFPGGAVEPGAGTDARGRASVRRRVHGLRDAHGAGGAGAASGLRCLGADRGRVLRGAGVARRRQAVPGHDRERVLHRRPIDDHQVAPQCRRPAGRGPEAPASYVRSHFSTASGFGSPPACTTLPSTTMPGVDTTPKPAITA